MTHPAVCDKSQVPFLMLNFSSIAKRWMTLSDYTQRNPKPPRSSPRKKKKKKIPVQRLWFSILSTCM
jgi:hypothetical protein